nr:putative ribonuclease H-like domain-containing protein [Tanacetum cinerariifolium]
METIITSSPTPTLRIHKDHPKSQIIGPLDTPIQTRNKSKEEEGIDYNEVFTPVARIKAIRLFLAYASFMGFTVYQMDVKSAFLYGTIDEEVYVMQPPRFQDLEFPAKVYKVEKAMGTIDQTLFIIRQREDFILVQVYVDDIIFGSLNPQLCREFEARMHEKFQMSAMDSDYGGATQDHKSTTGGCQFLGRRLISWQCKKQTIVATSTTEAEYVAAASCCGKVIMQMLKLVKDWSVRDMKAMGDVAFDPTIVLGSRAEGSPFDPSLCDSTLVSESPLYVGIRVHKAE